jgi:hypothetical protein
MKGSEVDGPFQPGRSLNAVALQNAVWALNVTWSATARTIGTWCAGVARCSTSLGCSAGILLRIARADSLRDTATAARNCAEVPKPS